MNFEKKRMDVNNVINEAKAYAWQTQRDNCYWLYPPYLGSFFISQYYLVCRYLSIEPEQSKLDPQRLKQILVDTQRSDGGWEQVGEPNRVDSNLDASLFNYWFLKASGSFETDDEVMRRARKFILDQGGVVACSHMTKIWLCLFGQFNWDEIAPIPLLAFRDDHMFSYTNVRNFVAQWVYPHVLPIALLRYWKKQKNLGARFDINELYVNEQMWHRIKQDSAKVNKVKRPRTPPSNCVNMIKKLASMRRPLGTYGAYSVSTLFSLIALQDWKEHYKMADETKYESEFKQSISFVEELYFNSYESSYLGVLDDGRWWDTLLVAQGLLECGEECDKFVPVIEHFLKHGVQSNGGIAYGLEFEYAPDTDDTGVMVLILAKYFRHKYQAQFQLANEWLISMQNTDGGFGAFAKGNYDFLVVRLFAGNFQNSAEIFDASSVDVTAHILEGWVESGYTMKDTHVQRAIAYIKNQQTDFGAWEGRWGCNYIYSVGAVLSAVANLKGLDIASEPWLKRAIEWLVQCQNEDGGFGESTQSYTDKKWVGKGKSTVSQTAWAVLALVEAERVKLPVRDELDRAVKFLVDSFDPLTKHWTDCSSVGTGHRRLLYMQYPVYALAWPLIALGRYKQLVSHQ